MAVESFRTDLIVTTKELEDRDPGELRRSDPVPSDAKTYVDVATSHRAIKAVTLEVDGHECNLSEGGSRLLPPGSREDLVYRGIDELRSLSEIDEEILPLIEGATEYLKTARSPAEDISRSMPGSEQIRQLLYDLFDQRHLDPHLSVGDIERYIRNNSSSSKSVWSQDQFPSMQDYETLSFLQELAMRRVALERQQAINGKLLNLLFEKFAIGQTDYSKIVDFNTDPQDPTLNLCSTEGDCLERLCSQSYSELEVTRQDLEGLGLSFQVGDSLGREIFLRRILTNVIATLIRFLKYLIIDAEGTVGNKTIKKGKFNIDRRCNLFDLTHYAELCTFNHNPQTPGDVMTATRPLTPRSLEQFQSLKIPFRLNALQGESPTGLTISNPRLKTELASFYQHPRQD